MSQVVLSQAGPLPIKTTVMWPSSETVMVALSGSAWSPSANSTVSVKLSIHATTIGTVQMYANVNGTHMAFPTGFFAVNGEIGETTLEITANNATTLTDLNDTFTVALIF
ncbi:MAG TPA: hypothetical protein VF665_04765 [Longimicrobium sp.]|jgi:hypothetical protein|uniref:hypothetical protein n=1 Tax=Longimicrobium sp. TaxID=2029185 RepID=UPI002ED93C26